MLDETWNERAFGLNCDIQARRVLLGARLSGELSGEFIMRNVVGNKSLRGPASFLPQRAIVLDDVQQKIQALYAVPGPAS